jgi:hypothetical protein
MATKTIVQPRIVGSDLNDTKVRFAGGPECPHFQEAATQTFGQGDLIYLNGSGQLAIATIDGSNRLNVPVAGIANLAATGVQGTKMNFPIFRDDLLVEMNIYHGTPASAALALTMLGQVCCIKKINSKWVCDVETAIGTAEGAALSLAKCKIVDFVDKVGDIYARVLVKIVPFSIETDGGGLVRNMQLS